MGLSFTGSFRSELFSEAEHVQRDRKVQHSGTVNNGLELIRLTFLTSHDGDDTAYG